MMKKRKILLLLILLLSLINYNNKVHAAGFSATGAGSQNGSGNSNNNSNSNPNNKTEKEYQDGNKKIKYSYTQTISVTNDYAANLYDMNKQTMMPEDFNKFISGRIIYSGTWVGVNITEEKSASWNVSNFEFKEIKKKYTCEITTSGSRQRCFKNSVGAKSDTCSNTIGNYTYKILCYTCPTSSTYTVTHEKEYYEEFECPAGELISTEEIENNHAENETKKNDACKAARGSAIGAVQTSSGIVYIKDSNDNDITKGTIEISARAVKTQTAPEGCSGTVLKTFEYSPENTCINTQNGNVTYNKECTKNEAKIEEEKLYDENLEREVNYWKYFIPLNTKSSENSYISFSKNDEGAMTREQCEDVLKKYPNNYQTFIIGKDGNTLSGTNDDKNKIQKGCYFSTQIKIPVVQKFYYEEPKNNKITFKGYNFYYRPIDISNAFPNEPVGNSWWKNWYDTEKEKGKEKIQIPEPFDKISYEAKISSSVIKNIKDRNEKYKYPDFTGIGLDGTSEFLRINEITKSNGKPIYALGAGEKTKICNIGGKKVAVFGSDCS